MRSQGHDTNWASRGRRLSQVRKVLTLFYIGCGCAAYSCSKPDSTTYLGHKVDSCDELSVTDCRSTKDLAESDCGAEGECSARIMIDNIDSSSQQPETDVPPSRSTECSHDTQCTTDQELCLNGKCVAPCEKLIGPKGCCAGERAYQCWNGTLYTMDCDDAATPYGSPDGFLLKMSGPSSCSTSQYGSGCSVGGAMDSTTFCPWCVPECTGLECGPDGCGGSCGVCDTGNRCLHGKCVEKACCGGGKFICGYDEECGQFCGFCFGTCGFGACGDCDDSGSTKCPLAELCLGFCECDCAAKGCGPSGCGDACGLCPPGMFCATNGACVPFHG